MELADKCRAIVLGVLAFGALTGFVGALVYDLRIQNEFEKKYYKQLISVYDINKNGVLDKNERYALALRLGWKDERNIFNISYFFSNERSQMDWIEKYKEPTDTNKRVIEDIINNEITQNAYKHNKIKNFL